MNIQQLNSFIRDIYQTDEVVPLHAPAFLGEEKQLVMDTLDSTFVSSVGQYVEQFESGIQQYTGAASVSAVVNGTAALHTALYTADVGADDYVITQALTFVATCNAIAQLAAKPIFVDIETTTLGMCPEALEQFLQENAEVFGQQTRLKTDKKVIKAVVPMHTFGHPTRIDEIKKVCRRWHLTLVEDAAESLGSRYQGQHTGTFGQMAAISFNGNKIITTGGGGAILTNDIKLGNKIRHLSTTAKVVDGYEFTHDEIAFNYRMPNINAALGCGQLSQLEHYIAKKRDLAESYRKFFDNSEFQFVNEPPNAKSNYWLNAVVCESRQARDHLLKTTNDAGVMTRPVWKLMHLLPMYRDCPRGPLLSSEYLADRVVNLPSSVPVSG